MELFLLVQYKIIKNGLLCVKTVLLKQSYQNI
jgi:hypothetical protein